MDELNDIEVSVLGRSLQGVALSVAKVGWDSNDGSIDILSEEVRCGFSETAQVTGGYLGDSNSARFFAGGIANGESNGGVVSLRMRGCMTWGWVYRLETVKKSANMSSNNSEVLILLAKEILEICDCVVWVSDQLRLCLGSVVLFTVDVGQYRWDMAVFMVRQHLVEWHRPDFRTIRTSFLVGDHLSFSLLSKYKMSS